ncbi:MAG: four helix bundle protein [Anaerohalosphaeraceae bacterium]|nr:four helix bundle protein [Anaerohalosphaeraceae bacterium]
MSQSIVKEKSYEFALRVIKLCSALRNQNHYEIANQLLKSGTSIGANVEEALAGQSKKDFYAKMCIASKEARETNYWLRLIGDSGILPRANIESLRQESIELCKILTSIVKTGYDKQ